MDNSYTLSAILKNLLNFSNHPPLPHPFRPIILVHPLLPPICKKPVFSQRYELPRINFKIKSKISTIKFIEMDKLLMSRRTKQENQDRLVNLSPEKYGKGAYAELTFTPSKLADNVLFRQASSLKRVQVQNCKNREFQAHNQVLNDQVNYLKKERDGISESLNQIITMYKTILAEMEAKNDERIKDIQKKFKEEMQKVILDKEEEAKYFQSEKEILEETITDLQAEIGHLKDQIHSLRSARDTYSKDLEISLSENKRLEEKLQLTEAKSKEEINNLKQSYDTLKKDSMNAEVEWKSRLNEELHKKDKEIESIQRTHRAEFERLETQRNSETMLKNQELNELTKAFESESSRLNEIITTKDRVIDQLTIQNNKEKTRILNLTRDYEAEINLLTHEKNRLIDQLEHFGRENEYLTKDKMLLAGDLESQNNNLRDLLLQSSVQLQKCKNQFLDLAKENTTLLTRLKSAEEEARTWRESYYINKNRPY